VKENLEKLDLFIFTVRLGETWVHGKSKKPYPTAPPTIAGGFQGIIEW
jgi:hypothetical protein